MTIGCVLTALGVLLLLEIAIGTLSIALLSREKIDKDSKAMLAFAIVSALPVAVVIDPMPDNPLKSAIVGEAWRSG